MCCHIMSDSPCVFLTFITEKLEMKRGIDHVGWEEMEKMREWRKKEHCRERLELKRATILRIMSVCSLMSKIRELTATSILVSTRSSHHAVTDDAVAIYEGTSKTSKF